MAAIVRDYKPERHYLPVTVSDDEGNRVTFVMDATVPEQKTIPNVPDCGLEGYRPNTITNSAPISWRAMVQREKRWKVEPCDRTRYLVEYGQINLETGEPYTVQTDVMDGELYTVRETRGNLRMTNGMGQSKLAHPFKRDGGKTLPVRPNTPRSQHPATPLTQAEQDAMADFAD